MIPITLLQQAYRCHVCKVILVWIQNMAAGQVQPLLLMSTYGQTNPNKKGSQKKQSRNKYGRLSHISQPKSSERSLVKRAV